MDDKRFLAISSSNGITFFSRIFPSLAVESYYNENNKLKVRVHLDSSTINYETSVSPTQACQIMDLTICANTITTIIAALIIMLSDSLNIINIGIVVAMLCFVQKGLFAYYFFHIFSIMNFTSKNGTARSLGRFHGAEHKALNAYEKLGRVPNYEEVKKESRLAKDCGSLVHFNKIVLDTFYCFLIIVYTRTIDKIFKMISLAGQTDNLASYGMQEKVIRFAIAILILVVILQIFHIIRAAVINNSLLRFLEIFVTKEPTEKEIDVAINGIENLEIAEYNVLNDLLQKMNEDF